MRNRPNIIDGTIVIANPALVVEREELDVVKLKADSLPKQTKLPFNYGNLSDPTIVGEPVKVIQGKYAFVLVGLAEEPISPEDFFRMSSVIAQELPVIKGVGTVRQDFIPVISEDYAVAYVGDLKLVAYPLPPEPEEEPEDPSDPEDPLAT